MTRDSSVWTFLFVTAVCGFLLANFDLLSRAFPVIGPVWKERLELFCGLGGFISGYLKFSPLPLSVEGQVTAATGKPLTTFEKIAHAISGR